MSRARVSLLSVAIVCLLALPSVASARSPAPPPPPRAADPIGAGRAVPIGTDGPAWYDLIYHRRVMAAGIEGVPLPPGVAAPGALGITSPGIRPGLWLVSVTTDPVSFSWCTANFVFERGGSLGIGTAGHCAARDSLGGFPDVTAYVVPPSGSGESPGFFPIGRFVIVRDQGLGEDFAMVEIYPEFESWVDPTMPVWGGPNGVYTSNETTVVQYFGHGAVVGTGGTPRVGVAPVWTARGGRAYAFYGATAQGDSGAGVRVVSGEAAGNLTHIVIADSGGILPAMTAGTRMTRILQIAAGWELLEGTDPEASVADVRGAPEPRAPAVVEPAPPVPVLPSLPVTTDRAQCAERARSQDRRGGCGLGALADPLGATGLLGS